MNNANVAHLQDVPPNDTDWDFYIELWGCNADMGRNPATRLSYRQARRSLLSQLHLMANTVCNACGGFAHRAKDCPTNLRLGMLSGSNSEWKTLIGWVRPRVEVRQRERNVALLDLPVYHQVPKVCGRKRAYAPAFPLK